jgi:hypothetical protein
MMEVFYSLGSSAKYKRIPTYIGLSHQSGTSVAFPLDSMVLTNLPGLGLLGVCAEQSPSDCGASVKTKTNLLLEIIWIFISKK